MGSSVCRQRPTPRPWAGAQPRREECPLFVLFVSILFELEAEQITTDVLKGWLTEAGFQETNQFALTVRSICLTAKRPTSAVC
jgi:hypothetical protein